MMSFIIYNCFLSLSTNHTGKKMNDQIVNEKKLVEAFKTFFDKSISPYVSNNDGVMNQWKYFSRLISSDPIDYSQIQFYILLANKSQHNSSPNISSDYSSNTPYTESRYNPPQTPSQLKNSDTIRETEKKLSNSKSLNSPKKKNLINCLESFQSLLVKNQERLQNFARKDMPNQTIGGNNTKRYY